jgi:Skp family chaperone for outer membrane proteins
VKKILLATAAIAALTFAGAAAAQDVKPASGTSAATLKIGYINITKVIKEFAKANAMGDKILADATRYEKELKDAQDVLKAEDGKLKLPNKTEEEKDAIRKGLYKMQSDLSEKDLAYQKDIRKRRDDMAIEINTNIQRVIDSLAKHHALELVLTCPDVADTKEVGSLSDAMRRMTAPAVWIAWKHKDLDITDECVKWLNHYFPAPAGTQPPVGGNAAGGNGTNK